MTESDVTGFIAVNRLREHGNWWGESRERCAVDSLMAHSPR